MQFSLNILLILETSGGGSGRHVIDLSRGLSKQGHSVHIIYSGTRMEKGFGRALKALENVRCERVDMRRSPHPGDLAAIFRIRQYMRKHGPFDIVHGQSSKGGALARLAALGASAVTLYTPHAFRTLDPSLPCVARWLYKTIELGLCQISDGIVLVSEEECAHAESMRFPSEKLFVVHNGIEPKDVSNRAQARSRLGLSDEEICIGFVGRLVPQKSPERMLQAFSSLVSGARKPRLVMYGGGELETQMHALAEQLNISQQIIWLSGSDGASLMPAFDIFAMPSLYEAFPYVLLEAVAAGLAVVATHVGGTSALVQDNVNGILFHQDQPEAFTQALITLVENERLRREMGTASRKIAQEYSVEAMVDKTYQIYRDLLPPMQPFLQALPHNAQPTTVIDEVEKS